MAIYHYISGNPPVQGKPMVRRKNVLCIVQHWSDSTFAVLNWKKMHWHSFVMGGIDSDSFEDAGKREIAEELGYTDIICEWILPWEIHAEYFAAHKQVNRYSIERCVVYRLDSGKKHSNPLDDENHETLWLPYDKVESFLADVPGLSSNLAFRYQYTKQDAKFESYVQKMKRIE